MSATQMGVPEFNSQHLSYPDGMDFSNLSPKEAQTRESQLSSQHSQSEEQWVMKKKKKNLGRVPKEQHLKLTSDLRAHAHIHEHI